MAKTQATDATKVDTPVCIFRRHHDFNKLQFTFDDGHTLWISPERIQVVNSRKKFDIVRVRLSFLNKGAPKGEYGGRDFHGEKIPDLNEPLVRQYVEAAKSFVETEMPKDRDDRYSVKVSRRLINKALSYKS